ncbi:MAG: DUF4013 domain-containing protein [Candidatus Aureabacteria bacterium]|nr:DUF4013 domain-containing protein [Candidatus Auribacterota bacterium]
MFDKIIQRFKEIPKEEGWIIKVLIGGLVLYIPILNAVSFGYIMDLLEDVKEKREVKLPGWQNLEKLFMTGLPLSIFMLVLSLVQFIISSILGLIACIGPIISFAINLAILFLTPLLVLILAYRLIELRNWKEAMNWGIVLEEIQKNYKEYLPFLLGFLICIPVSFIAGCCVLFAIPYFYAMIGIYPLMGEVYVKLHGNSAAAPAQEEEKK